ncbi:MAG: hypothetical protein R2718_06285 [Solirubrobacterales bacterium]|nr:hypothetical protein [Solirubrobacterales bacterium]
MAEVEAGKTEEDRVVGWGWALGLVLPVVGLMAALFLLSRGDRRWLWMLGWAALGVVAYVIVFAVL